MILLNILVLVFEILYYSMFMYYAKGEGKFKRYLLLFTLITIIGLFIGTTYLYSYIYLIIMILIGMKLIVKCNVVFFDLFIIFIMMLFNFAIQVPFYLIMPIFTKNLIVITFSLFSTKILFLFFANKLTKIFKKIKKIWNNNNFYIRYLFIVFMFTYIILSVIYLLKI